MGQADEIDYKIGGEDIQYVEIELDPGESVVSEAGAMMYKSPSVTMEAVFGRSLTRVLTTQSGLVMTHVTVPAAAPTQRRQLFPSCADREAPAMRTASAVNTS